VTFQVEAPPLPRPVLFDHYWADLTFVHWPVRPESVAYLYPPGTRPDVFAGALTYVGLVRFVMRRTAVGTALPLQYFGTFAETNIRLYSVDESGRHGVRFSPWKRRGLQWCRSPGSDSESRTPGRRCGWPGSVTGCRTTACADGPGAGCATG